MYVSHHLFSKAAIEASKAGKRTVKIYESTNPNRIPAQTRMGDVPVVRGTGTDGGWPPHIPKPSGLKGHDFRATSPATSRSTLQGKEAGSDNQRRQQSASGKEDVRALKFEKEKENR